MKYGILNTNMFTLGNIDFFIDYQNNSYYGEKSYKCYVPSHLNDNCWNIDFTKQFRSEEKCKNYMIKCIKTTAKKLLKD